MGITLDVNVVNELCIDSVQLRDLAFYGISCRRSLRYSKTLCDRPGMECVRTSNELLKMRGRITDSHVVSIKTEL